MAHEPEPSRPQTGDIPVDPDGEVAGLLLVGLFWGAFSREHVVRWLDEEIRERETPSGWLIDASLARTPQDLISVLHNRSLESAACNDPIATVAALDVACDFGRLDEMDAARKACALLRERFPEDIRNALADLDEELFCAHDHDGLVRPERVRVAFAVLRARAAARGRWREDLRRLGLRIGACEAADAGG